MPALTETDRSSKQTSKETRTLNVTLDQKDSEVSKPPCLLLPNGPTGKQGLVTTEQVWDLGGLCDGGRSPRTWS